MIIFLLHGPLDNQGYGYSLDEVSPAVFSCISSMQYVVHLYLFLSLSFSLRLMILEEWEDTFAVWVLASLREIR